MGEYLDASSVEDAIKEGRRILNDMRETKTWDGFEIWNGSKLLFQFNSDVGYETER